MFYCNLAWGRIGLHASSLSKGDSFYKSGIQLKDSRILNDWNPQSSIWKLESRIQDCPGLPFMRRLIGNRSFRYELKQWNYTKILVTSSKVCNWTRKTFWVNILRRDLLEAKHKIKKWRQTAATARLLYPLNLSNVDDCFWSWILKDLKKREKKKIRPRVFRSYIIGRQRNVLKSLMHVQSCCFAREMYCFLTLSFSWLFNRK